MNTGHVELGPLTSLLKDPERLATLAATGLLDTPPGPTFDRFTRLARKILGAPISLLTLVNEDRQFF